MRLAGFKQRLRSLKVAKGGKAVGLLIALITFAGLGSLQPTRTLFAATNPIVAANQNPGTTDWQLDYSKLADDVAGLEKNTALEAIYIGQTVSVDDHSNGSVTLYAPHTEQLIVNGIPWSFVSMGDYIHFNVNRLRLPIKAK